MRPHRNTIVYLEAAVLAFAVLAAALFAAHAHGKRRARRAWLTGRGQS